MKDWFAHWFDSEYYHLLYKNRDDSEASRFINKLIETLPLKTGDKVLDLACGKGRHSVHLARAGFDVTGMDLSQNSIDYACQFAHEHLHFKIGDMRNALGKNDFDTIFNLFTSFGYFDSLEDNQDVINNIYDALKTHGLVVIDFMNAFKTKKHLVSEEQKKIQGVYFDIKRWCDGSHFYKEITITEGIHTERHIEKVQYIDLDTFKQLIYKGGLSLEKVYGNYDLMPYDADTSPRLILIAKKKLPEQ